MYCSKKNLEQLLPLITSYNEEKIIAWVDGQKITHGRFLADIFYISGLLPRNKYVFNLCEDRYLFLVTFAAIILNGQTNLLPPNRKSNEIADIADEYADCCYVSESTYVDLDLDKLLVRLPPPISTERYTQPPLIDKQHLAVVIFTSGSTGHAAKNLKTWHELVEGIRAFQTNLGLATNCVYSVVATVPAQHMYGLETSILLPLVGDVSISGNKPFYPEDILETINCLPQPVILVTTPLQLKACAYSGLAWPEIEFVLCSTAPLARELASEAEQAMETRVMEIYGSTETGAIASRRTAIEQDWLLFDGYRIDPRHTWFSAAHMPEGIQLNDNVQLMGGRKFRLMGRKADLIKIAGKRGSIGDLNSKLKSIAGVEDGVFFYPDDTNNITARLVALVVAPALDEKEIYRELSEVIDPVFLPRPLIKVEALPYSDTNKLRRSDLLELLRQNR